MFQPKDDFNEFVNKTQTDPYATVLIASLASSLVIQRDHVCDSASASTCYIEYNSP